MSRQENKDSVSLRAMSLSDMVDLCADCTALCLSRTERVITNSSRAPRGWESLYRSVAEERRNDDLALCEQRCRAVQQGCPSAAQLRRYEATSLPRGATLSAGEVRKALADTTAAEPAAATPSIHAISRCEHVAEVFASTLFLLAHKPSKLVFDNTLSQNSDSSSPAGDGSVWPEESSGKTEVHQKVLRGAADVDAEIMRRWSTARRERLYMQDHGILQVDGVGRREAAQAEASEDGAGGQGSGTAARATTPRW